jgi:hypothetical protein
MCHIMIINLEKFLDFGWTKQDLRIEKKPPLRPRVSSAISLKKMLTLHHRKRGYIHSWRHTRWIGVRKNKKQKRSYYKYTREKKYIKIVRVIYK